ncbi:MAG TPA: pitrilysin family protein [Gemmatimonadales bacterium]|nr:pitrilysin family protein [Gemmatimonadales bacterium]
MTAAVGLLLGLVAADTAGVGHVPPRPLDPDSLTTAREVAGVRIIQRINRRNDLVAMRLYLLGGTRQLTDHTAGIETLLLNAAAYGTDHYPGGQSQRAMARTGAIEVLEPEADWTVIGFITLRQDFDSAWVVFADRLTNPTLGPEAVRQARDQMLTSVRRRYADPDERIQIIANQGAFTGHPYALDPEGTEETLGAISNRDLTEYARAQLVTSRMLLVIVGNVDTASVSALVRRTIGTLPHGAYKWTLPPPLPHQDRSHWLIETRDLPTNYILGYITGPPVSHPDYPAFRVATDLLSSRLYEKIRVERGLSYAASAPFLERAVGVGGLYASTPKPEEVLPIMYDQIRWLLQDPLDGFVLHQFVTSFRLQYVARNGSDADQADLLARAELYLGDYQKTDRFLQQLYRIGPEDVRRVADRYMRIIQWAYIGNTERMEGHW